ncbi:acetylxylan esterase [Actinophytocola sp.]|uniref:acetylxylan esterase n=1 Tax=Actinophytocola sp. TaxID=1872138 RepID=UPI002ED683A1
MTDFDRYWETVDDELRRLPARPVLEKVPARTTDDYTFYDVWLTSAGPYRIFGYLSVPTGPGPFPAVLETPRYGSVNQVPHHNDRLRYLVFTVAHRGQRRADTPFAAAYPGLFTRGIEAPVSYVYRGIVADCLRGAEFLLSRDDVDRDRVAVSGDDELALFTAARRPGFTALRVDGPLFYRILESQPEELADHLRVHPDAAGAVADTLSYFDPVRHAPDVAATTLLAADDASWYEPLAGALPDAAIYPLTHEDAADNNTLDAWLAGQLGVEPMTRFR